jgi:putative redox protein
MEKITIEYLGDLRTSATHMRSGTRMMTDAPVDNMGKGESFSPTDLVATALGTCIITTIGIVARRENVDVGTASLDVTKIMADNPRRIGEIIVEMSFPGNRFSEKEKILIENTARACPVAKSLHPELKQTMIFHF